MPSRRHEKQQGSEHAPLLFLDIDDVLCVSHHHGGREAARALGARREAGAEPFPWETMFEEEARLTLDLLMQRARPRIIVTSTWLGLFNRAAMAEVFRLTGLASVADAMHEQWDAPQNRFETRLAAIERWLSTNHCGESFAVLDDFVSGTGLTGSSLEREGRVVLCEVGRGLHLWLLPALEAALKLPVKGRNLGL
ncbi:HAD domain-containing protein [Roseateles noduli]|uniref:HAD domain-containing protein n=1 Tax=Roseateles noduli TaxID=2052484 RepID=UPI003D65A7FF